MRNTHHATRSKPTTSDESLNVCSGTSMRIRISAAVIACLVASGMLAACGNSSTSAKSSTSSTKPPTQNLTFAVAGQTGWMTWFAKDAGFYARNGINVKILKIKSLAQSLAATVSGSSQVNTGIDMLGVGLAKGQNVDLKTFAGAGSTWAVLVGAGSEPGPSFPESIRSIAGQTIANTTPGSEVQDLMMMVDSLVGLPKDSMKYVSTQSLAGQVAALESHRLNYAMINVAGLYKLEADKFPFHVILDLRKPLTGAAATTSEGRALNQILGKPQSGTNALASWVDAHQSEVARIRLSEEEADCWVHEPANVPKLIKFVTDNDQMPEGLSPALQKQYVVENLPISYFSSEQWNTWYQVSVSSGLITKQFAPSSLYDSGTPQNPAQVYADVTSAGGTCPAYAHAAK